MRAKEAVKIPIARYLLAEGHKPARARHGGSELWYSSPIRTGDQTPSFKVNTGKNIWFDHGIGEGGDILNLVCALRKVTIKEALSILESFERQGLPDLTNSYLTNAASIYSAMNIRPKPADSAHEILKVQSISHPALIQYLAKRKIPLNLAQQYLKEIHYRRNNLQNTYFTLGWKNSEGYDTRNPFFKGFIGKGKDISVLNLKGNENVAIFEGFMDFLSLLAFQKQSSPKTAVIILHSIALKQRALKLIKEQNFRQIELYFDHDEGGRLTKDFFIHQLPDVKVIDRSDLYEGYKDLNEWIISTL